MPETHRNRRTFSTKQKSAPSYFISCLFKALSCLPLPPSAAGADTERRPHGTRIRSCCHMIQMYAHVTYRKAHYLFLAVFAEKAIETCARFGFGAVSFLSFNKNRSGHYYFWSTTLPVRVSAVRRPYHRNPVPSTKNAILDLAW